MQQSTVKLVSIGPDVTNCKAPAEAARRAKACHCCGRRNRATTAARAPSCLASFEVAAIVGRCLPGDPMKGSAERARAMETHFERDLVDRWAGVCQQGLGALNPPARPVAIRWLPEGLLEGS